MYHILGVDLMSLHRPDYGKINIWTWRNMSDARHTLEGHFIGAPGVMFDTINSYWPEIVRSPTDNEVPTVLSVGDVTHDIFLFIIGTIHPVSLNCLEIFKERYERSK